MLKYTIPKYQERKVPVISAVLGILILLVLKASKTVNNAHLEISTDGETAVDMVSLFPQKTFKNHKPVQRKANMKLKKKMYYPYLKNAYKLFLLTGCRREEVIDLKWSQIFTTVNGVKFFRIENSKVIKSNRAKNKSIEVAPKYIPINSDLYDLLLEIGYEKKKNSDEYIIAPDRSVTSKTLIDRVSKSFTHYKEESKIEKDISLKNLRKTYLSWVNAVMLKDTKILSSHASSDVLDKYYLDPTVLNAVEKGALEIKIFGT